MVAMRTTTSSLKRAWRLCARLLYAAVVVALVWLAAARWNGVPADPGAAPIDEMPSRIPRDPALDRSAELIAALKAIPAEPVWALPPPPHAAPLDAPPHAAGLNKRGDSRTSVW